MKKCHFMSTEPLCNMLLCDKYAKRNFCKKYINDTFYTSQKHCTSLWEKGELVSQSLV